MNEYAVVKSGLLVPIFIVGVDKELFSGLSSPKHELLDEAVLSGFSEQGAFNRAFKK